MRSYEEIDDEALRLPRRYPGIKEMPVQDEEHRRVSDYLTKQTRIDCGSRYYPESEIVIAGVRLVTMSRVMTSCAAYTRTKD